MLTLAGLPLASTVGGWALSAPARADRHAAPAAVRETLGPDARLVGEGTLRRLGFRIYDAQLWASPGGFVLERFEQGRFALQLTYRRAIPATTIVRVTADELERVRPALSLGARTGWMEALERLWPDVRDGDRLTGTHLAGRPAAFHLNDRRLGEVPDPAFGPAFFAIWLDARTAEPGLRAALTGAA